MSAKLKKRNPFLAFLIYFLSVNVFWGSLYVIFLGLGNSVLSPDYKLSRDYRAIITDVLAAGYTLADPEAEIIWNPSLDITSRDDAYHVLSSQGGNISYWIDGPNLPMPISSGTQAHSAKEFMEEKEWQLVLSSENYNNLAIRPSEQGYDHLLVIQDGILYENMNTRIGQRSAENPISMSRYYIADGGHLASSKAVICLAVQAEGAFTNNYGSIYSCYYTWFQVIVGFLVVSGAALVSLFVFLAVRLKKQSLDIAKAKLAAFTGWFWVECKALAAFLFLIIFFSMGYVDELSLYILLLCGFWGLWLIINDFRRNGKNVFIHNSIHSLKCMLDRFDSRYPFCARMKRRILFLVVSEFCLALLAVFLIFAMEEAGFIVDLFLVILGLFLLIRYIDTYNRDIDAFAAIIEYTAKIRAGTAEQPLVLPPENVFAPLAADLNDIHSGVSRMAGEQVRNEKMKVELITNVSHDLKTPLTSIINYVDLLGKENLSPDFANDYVKVLEKKAQRLKNLVQDLFEISKANSGAIDLNLEQLSIQSLVEQTVAELDQYTAQSGIEVKLQLCDTPLVVRADGKKLHRVFENLLGNALKYSLAGTRVYIAASQEGPNALIVFKNVAGYEMTFTAEEIVERFQRGDASRTTEGSGLGLAIAKSFLELNGGSLEIQLDGDLFKAIVRIPLYIPYAQRAVHQESAEEPEKEEPIASAIQTTEIPNSHSSNEPPFFREAEGGGLVSGPHAETAQANSEIESNGETDHKIFPVDGAGTDETVESQTPCQEG